MNECIDRPTSQPIDPKSINQSTKQRINHAFVCFTSYRYIADTEDVTLYHYRDCREIWVKEKNHLDCLKMERYTDDKALMLLRTVQTNIYRIKSVIGL